MNNPAWVKFRTFSMSDCHCLAGHPLGVVYFLPLWHPWAGEEMGSRERDPVESELALWVLLMWGSASRLYCSECLDGCPQHVAFLAGLFLIISALKTPFFLARTDDLAMFAYGTLILVSMFWILSFSFPSPAWGPPWWTFPMVFTLIGVQFLSSSSSILCRSYSKVSGLHNSASFP